MSIVLTERIAPDNDRRRSSSSRKIPLYQLFWQIDQKDWQLINEAIDIVDGQGLRDKEFKSLSDGENKGS